MKSLQGRTSKGQKEGKYKRVRTVRSPARLTVNGRSRVGPGPGKVGGARIVQLSAMWIEPGSQSG